MVSIHCRKLGKYKKLQRNYFLTIQDLSLLTFYCISFQSFKKMYIYTNSSFWIFRHLQRKKWGRGNRLIFRLEPAFSWSILLYLLNLAPGLTLPIKNNYQQFLFPAPISLVTFRGTHIDLMFALGCLTGSQSSMFKTEFLVIHLKGCSRQSFLHLSERRLHPFSYSMKALVVIS